MKKVILFTTVVALLVSLVVVPIAMAKKGDTPANDKPNTLYLYEKDAGWEIVWDGAWGKMSFDLTDETIDFVFNGHGLEKKTDYSLIYYLKPQTTWPWPVQVLASGTSNGGGNINLKDSTDLGVSNEITIWLVLSDDINDDGELAVWDPLEYLFEHNLIP